MLVSSQHIDVGAHQKSNKCFLNVIVGAGALVSKDLKPNGVYVGEQALRKKRIRRGGFTPLCTV